MEVSGRASVLVQRSASLSAAACAVGTPSGPERERAALRSRASAAASAARRGLRC
jgi:hypothetical protein